MILTDREILTSLEHGQIVIQPVPDPVRFSSTSVDLCLSNVIRVWDFDQVEKTKGEVITPGAEFNYEKFRAKYTKKVVVDKSKGYVLAPDAFVLGWTKELLVLPNHSRIAARVEGKSSLARLGLAVHVTAPTIHAGFEGPIQLEMCNLGPVSIRLTPDMPICQLIFEQTFGTPAKGYSGQFKKQKR
ncbi:MAG: dCTP deaminase [Planctomycetota bacterium]|nr:dCTP deaminase [Planctomycetota bacterium]